MKKWEAAGIAMQLSGVLLLSLLLPLLGGIWLDSKLGSSPLFILAGTGVGILAATVGVARMVLRMYGHLGSESGKDSKPSSGTSTEEEQD